jgi:glycosyltransferase involved in cell wall biosynthesis
MGQDVEVLVVPNGQDRSWTASMSRFEADKRVHVFPIDMASANAARNLGLSKAGGKYVRFLDDDDLLNVQGAIEQYEVLEATSAEICSGAIQLIQSDGRDICTLPQPDTSDFCVATLCPERRCMPVGHVYLASCLADASWNESTRVRQDVEWQLELCASREFHWIKTGSRAGAWRQHWAPRVSQAADFNQIRVDTVGMLLRTYESLVASHRINPARRLATADGLWEQIHNCFFLAPDYWTKVMRNALAIDPTSRPRTILARLPGLARLDPAVIEWLLVPKRWPEHKIRMIARRLKVRHAW